MGTQKKKLLLAGLFASGISAVAATASFADGNRIAFFVSDLSNVFHQSQAAEAERYASEEYGAEVVVFDGHHDHQADDLRTVSDVAKWRALRDP